MLLIISLFLHICLNRGMKKNKRNKKKRRVKGRLAQTRLTLSSNNTHGCNACHATSCALAQRTRVSGHERAMIAMSRERSSDIQLQLNKVG